MNADRFRRLLRPAIIAWAVGSILVGACARLAGAFPQLDLINQAAPFWLAAAIAGLIATHFAFSNRRERIFANMAFGLALIAHGTSIAPEFMRASPPPATASAVDADAPRVRIVWLNTQSGSSPEDVTEYLVNSGADFLLLGEYPEDSIPDELRAAYPHHAACREPHDCNVTLLSRHAPLAQNLAETDSTLRVTWADFEIEGAPLRVIATHLNRPYPARRYIAQRSELLSLVTNGPSDTVLAGDFNAAPWSVALSEFDRHSGLTRHDRAMPTWPAAQWTRFGLPALFAFMPIDHVYSGGAWRLVSIRRGPRTHADHFPIEAEFVWSPES